MAQSLKIIKKTAVSWWFEVDDNGELRTISDFEVNIGNSMNIVEIDGSKIFINEIANIEVKDETVTPNTTFNFINPFLLEQKLRELDFVPFRGQVPTSPGGGVEHAKGNYDASTNTPSLANGTGVRGDYYTVTVAGTQFGIAFKVNDRIEYNGGIWVKVIDNNVKSLINTTTGNDTSSDIVVKLQFSDETSRLSFGDLLFKNGTLGNASSYGSNQYYFQKLNLDSETFKTIYRADNTTTTATFQAPNTVAGTFTQPISVNNQFAGVNGDIIRTVTNATTVVLTLAQLNSQYPSATIGFRVQCIGILVGSMIYEKTETSWVSSMVSIVS